jgi:hypothetical protein
MAMEFKRNEYVHVEQAGIEEIDALKELIDLELVAAGGGIGDPIAY